MQEMKIAMTNDHESEMSDLLETLESERAVSGKAHEVAESRGTYGDNRTIRDCKASFDGEALRTKERGDRIESARFETKT